MKDEFDIAMDNWLADCKRKRNEEDKRLAEEAKAAAAREAAPKKRGRPKKQGKPLPAEFDTNQFLAQHHIALRPAVRIRRAS